MTDVDAAGGYSERPHRAESGPERGRPGAERSSRPGRERTDATGTYRPRSGDRTGGWSRGAGDRASGRPGGRGDRQGFDRAGSRPERRGGTPRAAREDDRRGAPGAGASTAVEPELAEDIQADQLDGDVRAELRSLSRPMAERVARHLVATGRLLDDDPAQALAHALAARRIAARIAAVREAVGLAAYHAEEWHTAITELRTYHRLTGRQNHLAVLADCERALGRPERAVDLYRGAEHAGLDEQSAAELLIVAAGARADMGSPEAAAAMLQGAQLEGSDQRPWLARMRYAYAEALLAAGRSASAREWFARALEVDEDQSTDAADRLLELDGVDLSGMDDEDLGDETGAAGEDGRPGDGAAGAESAAAVAGDEADADADDEDDADEYGDADADEDDEYDDVDDEREDVDDEREDVDDEREDAAGATGVRGDDGGLGAGAGAGAGSARPGPDRDGGAMADSDTVTGDAGAAPAGPDGSAPAADRVG